MSRVSPGSPTKWIATLSPRPASTWRSTQLYEAFSSPPTNHLASGASLQSRVWSKSLVHVRYDRALSAQNPSWSAVAASYSSALPLAAAANSALGGNLRFSWDRFSRVSWVTTSSRSQAGLQPHSSERFAEMDRAGVVDVVPVGRPIDVGVAG